MLLLGIFSLSIIKTIDSYQFQLPYITIDYLFSSLWFSCIYFIIQAWFKILVMAPQCEVLYVPNILAALSSEIYPITATDLEAMINQRAHRHVTLLLGSILFSQVIHGTVACVRIIVELRNFHIGAYVCRDYVAAHPP